MITYNGNDLSSLLKVKEIRRPILAPQKLSILSITGRDGAFYFRKQNSEYVVEVDVMIKGNSLQEVRNNVRNLADLLYTDKPQQLIFSDEPDKYIMATLTEDTNLSDTYLVSFSTLKFYCPDPYWYAVTDDILTYTSAGEKSFTRLGTAPSYPRFEIKGSNGNGDISISCNGLTMIYSGGLSATDTLIIDSTLITAYILKANGSSESVMNKLNNLDFPVFNKGLVNITFSAANGATISQIKVYCNSRWR